MRSNEWQPQAGEANAPGSTAPVSLPPKVEPRRLWSLSAVKLSGDIGYTNFLFQGNGVKTVLVINASLDHHSPAFSIQPIERNIQRITNAGWTDYILRLLAADFGTQCGKPQTTIPLQRGCYDGVCLGPIHIKQSSTPHAIAIRGCFVYCYIMVGGSTIFSCRGGAVFTDTRHTISNNTTIHLFNARLLAFRFLSGLRTSTTKQTKTSV